MEEVKKLKLEVVERAVYLNIYILVYSYFSGREIFQCGSYRSM